jgi:putative restriction endonuclease
MRKTYWLLLEKSDETRISKGIDGYQDQTGKSYQYDSLVPNHKNINIGDFIVLRKEKDILGVGEISDISAHDAVKSHRRCPGCSSTDIRERIRKRPKWKCGKCGHEFSEPEESETKVRSFTASIDPFTRLNVPPSVKDVKLCALGDNGPKSQHSMIRLDAAKIQTLLEGTDPSPSPRGPASESSGQGVGLLANLVLRDRSKYEATNYIRKAPPEGNYWVDFSFNSIADYKERCGDSFNIVIAGNPELEGDFFAIPYNALKHMLTESTLAKSKAGSRRWIGNVIGADLKLNRVEQRLDVSRWYGNLFQLENKTELSDTTEYNDFAIENRRIEISQRVKQSTFRKRVLENFQHCCCITGISESDLLIGSHIIPWSHRIETRLDPANGVCLSVLCDAFFDKGYISFKNDLTVIVSETFEQLSAATRQSLELMDGARATPPSHTPINSEFLAYHRENILRKN